MTAGSERSQFAASYISPTDTSDPMSEGEQRMYIAMNRFRVMKDCTHEFEQVWYTRESYLHQVPGFVEFHLLKGPERENHQLYASHTVWRTYADFEAWTKSEAFRKAHARAGENKPLTLGHPEFEGFHVLQEVKGDGQKIRRAAD